MNHKNKFSVSRFRNRNGVFSYRVDGHLNGVRIRRNFKTQEGAATEKAALELKGLQLASNLRAVTTVLAEDQVREAEAAFRRLADNDRSLAFYLDFALTTYREPVCQKPLSEAAEAYLAVTPSQTYKGNNPFGPPVEGANFGGAVQRERGCVQPCRRRRRSKLNASNTAKRYTLISWPYWFRCGILYAKSGMVNPRMEQQC